MTNQEKLYRINDVLTQLASELGVEWNSAARKDHALNDATHTVAEIFQIDGLEALTASASMNLREALDTVLEAAASRASTVVRFEDKVELAYRIETAMETISNWQNETFGNECSNDAERRVAELERQQEVLQEKLIKARAEMSRVQG